MENLLRDLQLKWMRKFKPKFHTSSQILPKAIQEGKYYLGIFFSFSFFSINEIFFIIIFQYLRREISQLCFSHTYLQHQEAQKTKKLYLEKKEATKKIYDYLVMLKKRICIFLLHNKSVQGLIQYVSYHFIYFSSMHFVIFISCIILLRIGVMK